MNTVYCPVMGEQVDGTTCLEIALVADRMIKASVLPTSLQWSDAQREKCLSCKWHDDVESED